MISGLFLFHIPVNYQLDRLWATRLHLYGDDEEEQKKLSAANQLLAGLPVSTDDIPAEDQLMLLGIAEVLFDCSYGTYCT